MSASRKKPSCRPIWLRLGWSEGNMTHPIIAPAHKVCDLLQNASDGKLTQEILVLDDERVGIVVDIDGVDYILTMGRVPHQRARPIAN